MIVVTESILYWINCCNDIWLKWFSTRDNSFEEFLDVQDFLFNLFVLNSLDNISKDISKEIFYDKLSAVYLSSVDESRQFCIKQRAGNVFCRSSQVSISKETALRVKFIDPIGTMNGGIPYVELIYEKGYILEPISNVEFVFDKK